MKLKIYTASSINGLDYETVISNYEYLYETLTGYGYSVLHPLIGKEYLRNEKKFKATGYNNSPTSTNKAIVSRDKLCIRQSNIVLSDLTKGQDLVSIGTVSEIALANELNKHTVTVMQEDNIHRHAFVIENSDLIFEYMDDALDYLRDLIQIF